MLLHPSTIIFSSLLLPSFLTLLHLSFLLYFPPPSSFPFYTYLFFFTSPLLLNPSTLIFSSLLLPSFFILLHLSFLLYFSPPSSFSSLQFSFSSFHSQFILSIFIFLQSCTLRLSSFFPPTLLSFSPFSLSPPLFPYHSLLNLFRIF